MNTILIPGRGEVQVPTRWGEVTLGQAKQLLSNPDAERDVYGCLASLLGPWATRQLVQGLPIAQVGEPAEVGDVLLESLVFLAEPMPTFDKLPEALELRRDGQLATVPIPRALKLESFGQACDLGTSIEALAADVTALRIRALAIYLLPKYTGGAYDTDRLAEVEAAVADVPLELALPVSDFFLPISRQPQTPTGNDYSTASSPTPSAELASTSSASVGTDTPSPMRWRRAMRYGWKAFIGYLGVK